MEGPGSALKLEVEAACFGRGSSEASTGAGKLVPSELFSSIHVRERPPVSPRTILPFNFP